MAVGGRGRRCVAVALAIVGVRFALRSFSPRIGSRQPARSCSGLGYALVLGASGKLVLCRGAGGDRGAAAVLLLALRRRRASGTRSRRRDRALPARARGGARARHRARRGAPGARAERSRRWAAGCSASIWRRCCSGSCRWPRPGLLDTRDTAEWFIAVRYLVAKRRQTFISVITGICVVGIAAGVWLIITVLSVMNGFERTWRDEIIGNRAHFTVQQRLRSVRRLRRGARRASRRVPGVVAALALRRRRGHGARRTPARSWRCACAGIDPAARRQGHRPARRPDRRVARRAHARGGRRAAAGERAGGRRPQRPATAAADPAS